MPAKKIREQNEEKLKNLIRKSILIDEADAEYWLGKLPTMPDEILVKVIRAIEKNNDLAEEYVKQGLKNDKKEKSLHEMHELVGAIQKTAVSIEEKYQGDMADEEILKKMDDI